MRGGVRKNFLSFNSRGVGGWEGGQQESSLFLFQGRAGGVGGGSKNFISFYSRGVGGRRVGSRNRPSSISREGGRKGGRFSEGGCCQESVSNALFTFPSKPCVHDTLV